MKTKLAAEFIAPKLIGETVHPVQKAPTGVHVYGLIVDPAGYMVAGIFGARASRLNRFTPEIHIGLPFTVSIGEAYVACKPAVAGSYEIFEYTHPEGHGRLLLYIDKTAMLSHQVEANTFLRFFAIGPLNSSTPFWDLWARRLQNILSVSILPEWREQLWAEMVEQAWIAPCTNYGGFGSAWDVYVSGNEATEKLLQMIKDKELI